MLSGEFAARAAKLKKEQQARLRLNQQRQQAEKNALHRQQERIRAAEEDGRQRRLAEVARQDEMRLQLAHNELQREADIANNRGVTFEAQLQAVPLDASSNTRGIKRAADKVLLPASVGATLLQQNAMVAGTPYFEVATPDARTHVGVLDYSAAEGTVALPLQVVHSLWGPDATLDAARGLLHVKFVRLDKGTYVKFQPRQAAFQKALGDGMSDALEALLHKHSALSVGDWLSLEHGDSRFDLRVLELHPSSSVSVIDTEMEAEVEVSAETEERLAGEAAAAARRAEQLAAIRAAEQRRAAEAAAEAQRRAEEVARQSVEIEAARQAKAAALPEEPPVSAADPIVTCVLRFPDGNRVARRFRTSDLLQALFDFTDAKGSASDLAPGTYKLVAQMPRRVLHPSLCGQDVTLQAAGLQKGQEMIMLEPL